MRCRRLGKRRLAGDARGCPAQQPKAFPEGEGGPPAQRVVDEVPGSKEQAPKDKGLLLAPLFFSLYGLPLLQGNHPAAAAVQQSHRVPPGPPSPLPPFPAGRGIS